jgi:hypothetical protein
MDTFQFIPHLNFFHNSHPLSLCRTESALKLVSMSNKAAAAATTTTITTIIISLAHSVFNICNCMHLAK